MIGLQSFCNVMIRFDLQISNILNLHLDLHYMGAHFCLRELQIAIALKQHVFMYMYTSSTESSKLNVMLKKWMPWNQVTDQESKDNNLFMLMELTQQGNFM